MDAFAILGLDRGPWIEPDKLQEHYLKAVKDAHPDQNQSESTSSDDAAQINEAHQVLANPANRLAHFVQLETEQDITKSRQVPEPLVELFMRLGPLFQQCDQLIRNIKEADSNILKARQFVAAGPVLQSLNEIQEQINQTLQASHGRLKSLHENWISSKAPDRTQLLNAMGSEYGTLSYLQRWRDTINEKTFELTPS